MVATKQPFTKPPPVALADRGIGRTKLAPTVVLYPVARIHLAAASRFNPIEKARESLDDIMPMLQAESDFDIELRALPDEWTPLTHAARTGTLGALTTLINMGADVNARDKHANTPLHKAVISGAISKIETLLDSGAELEASNRYGRTPLHEAAHFGHTNVCELLARYGARHDAKDGPLRDMKTPTEVAIAESGVLECCDVLAHNERQQRAAEKFAITNTRVPRLEPSKRAPRPLGAASMRDSASSTASSKPGLDVRAELCLAASTFTVNGTKPEMRQREGAIDDH